MSVDVPQVDGGGGVNDAFRGKLDEAVFENNLEIASKSERILKRTNICVSVFLVLTCVYHS